MNNSEIIEKKWTYQDLLNEPDETFEGFPYVEILDNELFMTASPRNEHQRISAELQFQFMTYLKRTKAGTLRDAPFDLVLNNNNVLVPDLLVVLNENKSNFTDLGYSGSPDLVVEILSPSTYSRDLNKKKEIYQRFGVKEYWIVDPKNRVIQLFFLREGKYELSGHIAETGILKSVLLIGFEVDARDIFESE